jgi:glycine cleavage system aminomethyltransferase T
MAAKTLDVGLSADAIVARLSLTGEMGYEITVPTSEHRALWLALRKVRPVTAQSLPLRPTDIVQRDTIRFAW